MGGINKMPSKTLEREETLAANALRTISQKSLVEMTKTFEKVGLIVNNSLSIAMMDWKKFEGMVDLIQEQVNKIEELESLLEDMELSRIYGEDILRAERQESKTYPFNSVESLFETLDD